MAKSLVPTRMSGMMTWHSKRFYPKDVILGNMARVSTLQPNILG